MPSPLTLISYRSYDNLSSADLKLETDALCHKKHGDELRKKGKYEEAIECYNMAIELDDTNCLFLFCKASAYFKVRRLDECMEACKQAIAAEDSKFITDKIYDSVLLARVYNLMGDSFYSQEKEWFFTTCRCSEFVNLISGTRSACNCFEVSNQVKDYYMAALLHDPPYELFENLLSKVNQIDTRDRPEKVKPTNSEFLCAGLKRYSILGDRSGAIDHFTGAVHHNEANAVAHACRAICYAENNDLHALVADVSKCIELDYRFFSYFLSKAEEMRLSYQLKSASIMLQALDDSETTLKSSAGRIFPKLLLDLPLNGADIERCKKLNKSWQRTFLPILGRLEHQQSNLKLCKQLFGKILNH